MALIVEDGTAKADAESYITVAAADTYHGNRGATAWAALSTSAKEQLLRKATDYMVQRYRGRWKGYRKTDTQALDWPRYEVILQDAPLNNIVSDTVVPPLVAYACAELALTAITTTLLPTLARAQSEVTVGPLTVKYDPLSSEVPRFPMIDGALRPYLSGSANNVKVVRT